MTIKKRNACFFAVLIALILGITCCTVLADENQTIQEWKALDAEYSSNADNNITITASFDSNGDLRINWTPVTDVMLLYMQHLTEDEAKKGDIGKQIPLVGLVEKTDLPLVMQNVVPGEKYLLAVYTGDYTMGKMVVKPYREEFDEFKPPRLTVELKKKINGNISKVKSFSAKELKDAYGTENFGLYIEHNMPKLGKPREYATRLVAVAPDGTVRLLNYVVEKYKSGGGNTDRFFWNYIPVTSLTDMLVDMYGYVLSGEYEVRMYYDTKFVNSARFTVTN